jgi:hypothetical protein
MITAAEIFLMGFKYSDRTEDVKVLYKMSLNIVESNKIVKENHSNFLTLAHDTLRS